MAATLLVVESRIGVADRKEFNVLVGYFFYCAVAFDVGDVLQRCSQAKSSKFNQFMAVSAYGLQIYGFAVTIMFLVRTFPLFLGELFPLSNTHHRYSTYFIHDSTQYYAAPLCFIISTAHTLQTLRFKLRMIMTNVHLSFVAPS